MILEIVVRLFGMILLGAAGWRLGEYLASTALPESYLRYSVVALTLAGAAIGALVAPWVTIKPIRYLRHKIQELPAQELFAIIVGLIVGLIVAALLSPVLANLPSPFGDIMPFVGAILFGYLGVMVATMRRKDLFALLSSRFSKSAEAPQDEQVSFARHERHHRWTDRRHQPDWLHLGNDAGASLCA